MLRCSSSGEHGIKLPRTQRREGMCSHCCQSSAAAKRRMSCSTAVSTIVWLFQPHVCIWTQGDPGLPGPPGPPGQVGEQSRQPETEIQRGDKVILMVSHQWNIVFVETLGYMQCKALQNEDELVVDPKLVFIILNSTIWCFLQFPCWPLGARRCHRKFVTSFWRRTAVVDAVFPFKGWSWLVALTFHTFCSGKRYMLDSKLSDPDSYWPIVI